MIHEAEGLIGNGLLPTCIDTRKFRVKPFEQEVSSTNDKTYGVRGFDRVYSRYENQRLV